MTVICIIEAFWPVYADEMDGLVLMTKENVKHNFIDYFVESTQLQKVKIFKIRKIKHLGTITAVDQWLIWNGKTADNWLQSDQWYFDRAWENAQQIQQVSHSGKHFCNFSLVFFLVRWPESTVFCSHRSSNFLIQSTITIR